MLGSVVSEGSRLANSEIIFQDSRLMWWR